MESGVVAMRNTWVALLVLATVVGAFATSSLADNGRDDLLDEGGYEGNTGGNGKKPLPCCDSCGTCTKSIPPLCTCRDNLLVSCPAWCKKCVLSPYLIYPPRYQCLDRIANYCKRRCTPRPLGNEQPNHHSAEGHHRKPYVSMNK